MGDQPRITYVVSRWGEPTQTFVRREAEAVAAAGVPVRVLSLKPFGPEVGGADVVRFTPGALVAGLVRASVAHPRRVARVVSTIARYAAPRNVPRLLVAAITGIAWTGARCVGPGDHLHAHFGWVAAGAAWAAAEVSGARFSVVLHAFEIHTVARVDRFTPVPLRAATALYTVTRRDADLVTQRWGVHPRVLRMGVPAVWLEEDPEVGASEPWHVVSVGSLLPKKGHDILLAALAMADVRWRLTIVGEGPEREHLVTRTDELGLGERVELVGSLPESEVQRLLRRATVFALACVVTPSGDRDGIPVALMEAMASGTPVVTTRVSGIPELVEGSGLLVEAGEPAAFASALDRLADPALRDELARAARAVIARSWTSEAAAKVLVAELMP